MATLRAYVAVDMTNPSGSTGTIVDSTATRFVVTSGDAETVYTGAFEYPGDDWTGTIETLSVLDDDVLQLAVTGLSLSTEHAMAEASLATAFRVAFAGADKMTGSSRADVLFSYGGNDRISGGSGNDKLAGGDGDDVIGGGNGNDLIKGQNDEDRLVGGYGKDRLYGGNGDDDISGGADADRLIGGRGDDELAGGSGADIFYFARNEGTDRVEDFQNGIDHFRILSGATRFADLAVTQVGDDVRVAFGGTVFFVEDTSARHIGAGDFIF